MDAKTVFDRAFASHQRGELAQAAELYARLLAARPGHPQVSYLLGALRGQQGRHDEALALLEAAHAARPNNAAVLLHMGNALQGLKRFDEAVARYGAALAIKPKYDEALNNRGNALRAAKRLGEALESYDAALAINSGAALFWYNRGTALVDLGRHAEAVADFDRALTLQPDFAMALNNKASALQTLQLFEEALAVYGQALALEPDNIDFLVNQATILVLLKRYAEAQAALDRVMTRDPSRPSVFGYRAQCALFLCDWARLKDIRDRIAAHIRSGSPEMPPLVAMSYTDDPALQRQCAENIIHMLAPKKLPPLWTGPRRGGGKIRVAYVSSDLRAHPVGFQLVQLLEQHDRERFEIIAVSTGEDDGSQTRDRIRRACGIFHDARGKQGRQIAELVRDTQADIAVDLSGHTHGNHLPAFAERPAPVQAAWLGYPGTTGADFIDFLIADPVALPLTQQPFYSETILHLPDSFFPLDTTRPIGTTPSRAQAGLPDKAFVFCCFNQNWKIVPPVFDIWMRLLRAVPGSILWLKDGWEDVMRREAAARGVAPERLVFAGHAPLDSHLARHRLADLFLDTLPYNAHATAADALLAGLPVLTRLGDTFPGRVAASLVIAAGLPELVARDAQDYEALALELARDPARLAAIRGKLAANRATAPLFDSKRFARNLEALYERMLEMKRAGRP